MFEYLVKIVQENAPLILIVGLALWRIEGMYNKLDRRVLKLETILRSDDDDDDSQA